MHKCIGADGAVRYADRACAAAEKAAPIAAAPIAAPTAQDAEAAEGRRKAANEQSNELDRRRDQAAAESRAAAIGAAHDRVRQLKRDHFHPQRCFAARHALERMRRRDPIGWRMDVSAFEHQQQAALYCGP